jgi:hypothetical protein
MTCAAFIALCRLSSPVGQACLTRLLSCFCLAAPHLGYCQVREAVSVSPALCQEQQQKWRQCGTLQQQQHTSWQQPRHADLCYSCSGDNFTYAAPLAAALSRPAWRLQARPMLVLLFVLPSLYAQGLPTRYACDRATPPHGVVLRRV